MKNIKQFLIKVIFIIVISFGGIAYGSYGSTLDDVTPSQIKGTSGSHPKGVRDFLINTIGKKILSPLIILIGLLIIFIGLYKMMFTETDEEQNRGKNFLIWGTIGVIILSSAIFITLNLVGQTGDSGVMFNLGDFEGISFAQDLYKVIFFPFLKLIMYVIMGILFLILVIHTFKFLMNPSDDIAKHSRTIIVWNTLGIIIIMSSKAIVELLYGRESQLSTNTKNLGNIGEGVITNRNISFIHNALNWFMSFVALFVVIVIIYQAFMLLIKPNDSENLGKLKKSIIYAFIGVLVIGAGYLISNFLTVK